MKLNNPLNVQSLLFVGTGVASKAPARVISFFLLLFFAGCGKEDIRVYRVAKEAKEGVEAPLTWNLPASWQELPAGNMRVASFAAKGQNGKIADVSVIPLPGMSGGLLNNVNRWREQVGQPPVKEDDLDRLAQVVEIDGQPAKLFEQTGTAQDENQRTNILAAFLDRGGVSWFFKMTGDAQLVSAQKPVFVDFLKSVKFKTSATQQELPPSHPPIAREPPASPAGISSKDDSFEPKWNVPPGWKKGPPSQFLVAKFLVSGDNNSQAAVNISATGGGLTLNINRWRQQLSLPPITDAEVQKQVQPLEVPGSKAMLIDMNGVDSQTGQKARTVAAIVPQGDRTWYYKLMGDEHLVEREKQPFIDFVKSATYPQ